MDLTKDQCDDPPVLTRDYTLDCAICLQPFVQPVKLPCSHTFCFLCAKGIALQRQPCALCRAEIPADLLTKPQQFQVDNQTGPADFADIGPDKHVWFYQGHKGWWQYDERTSTEIEEAFSREEKSVDILIAGAIYVVDFEAMMQYQRHTNSRKRKIKRDSITAEKKGIAGMSTAEASGGSSGLRDDDTTKSTRQGPVGKGND